MGDDVEFFDTLGNEPMHFAEDFVLGARCVFACNVRNCAVRTISITSFCYLEISEVRRSGEEALVGELAGGIGFIFVVVNFLDLIYDGGEVEFPEPGIDFRDFGLEICEVAFRETSHYEDVKERVPGY